MTIDEAIEILTEFITEPEPFLEGDEATATKLGIDALKRHQSAPDLTSGQMLLPLPGETERRDYDPR